MTRLLASCCLAVLLTPAVRADTIVVDDDGGPGVDFLAIQPAIDAASPGDVIVVRSGTYAAFVLDEPLSIVTELDEAFANVIVLGTVVVTGVPAGTAASLSGFFTEFLRVEDCAGTVLGDVLGVSSPTDSLGADDDFCIEIVDAADVRMRQLGLNPGSNSGRGGVLVLRSRFEADGAAIDGARGIAGTAGTPDGGDGGVGILCGADSLVHVTNGRVRGGNGGAALFGAGATGGDGGDAFRVEATATLVVNGSIETQVYGGWAGAGSVSGRAGCGLYGQAGPALRVLAGGDARVSADVTLEGGFSLCDDDVPVTVVDGALAFADPPDLNLHVAGSIPLAGIPASIDVLDVPGTQVLLLLGVQPQVVPVGKKWNGNPLLVAPLVNLGPFALAGGALSIPYTIPAGVPIGVPIVLQALGLRPDGGYWLSNSGATITAPPVPPQCEPFCLPEE